MLARSAGVGILVLLAVSTACDDRRPETRVESWVSDPEVRFTPGSYSRDLETRVIRVEGLRNETVSAQVGVLTNSPGQRFSARLAELIGPSGARISNGDLRIRYPGYVLADEAFGYMSDPLMEEDEVELFPNRAQGIWFTIHIPEQVSPGLYSGRIELLTNGSAAGVIDLELKVINATLPPPQEFRFFLNILQDAASIARVYKVPLWSEEHFELITKYARNLAEHGQQSITAAIVSNPWRDNGIEFNRLPSMIEWQYPGEWDTAGAGHFTFDYSVFDRYVETHTALGIEREITCLSPVIGPGRSPDSEIAYRDTKSGEIRTRTVQVGTSWYEAAWSDFAKAFESHLKAKGWLRITYLLLDEKPSEIVEEVRRVFQRAAPELQLNISGSSGPTGEQNLLESPQWVLTYDELIDEKLLPPGAVEKRRSRGQITLFYTACGEYHPNTFVFSPLRESRMLPWVATRHDVDGYIRWAWNLWPEDVWNQARFRWPTGDMFFVYPGEKGPIDSTRWEMLRQGIQDVETLRILREKMAASPRKAELEREIEELFRNATRVHGCRGVSPIGTSVRARVNELLDELAR